MAAAWGAWRSACRVRASARALVAQARQRAGTRALRGCLWGWRAACAHSAWRCVSRVGGVEEAVHAREGLPRRVLSWAGAGGPLGPCTTKPLPLALWPLTNMPPPPCTRAGAAGCRPASHHKPLPPALRSLTTIKKLLSEPINQSIKRIGSNQ